MKMQDFDVKGTLKSLLWSVIRHFFVFLVFAADVVVVVVVVTAAATFKCPDFPFLPQNGFSTKNDGLRFFEKKSLAYLPQLHSEQKRLFDVGFWWRWSGCLVVLWLIGPGFVSFSNEKSSLKFVSCCRSTKKGRKDIKMVRGFSFSGFKNGTYEKTLCIKSESSRYVELFLVGTIIKTWMH